MTSSKESPEIENRDTGDSPYGFVYVGNTRVGYASAPLRGVDAPDGTLVVFTGNGGWVEPRPSQRQIAKDALAQRYGREVVFA